MYKVAIVEDQEFIANAIAEMIRAEFGFFEVCGVFHNGKSCLKYMENNRPDIVLTDIKMPQMNGIQLSEEIVKKWPHVKIIILSGYEDFEYARTAISLGVYRYLLKPCKKEELLDALKNAVKSIEEVRKKEDILQEYKEYIDCLPTLKQQAIISMMFTEKAPVHSKEYKMEHLLGENCLYLVAVDMDNGAKNDEDMEKEVESILFCCHNILSELLAPIAVKELFLCNRQIVLLVPTAHQERKRTEFYLKKACVRMQAVVKFNVEFFDGGTMQSVHTCRTAYENALNGYKDSGMKVEKNEEVKGSGDILEHVCGYIKDNYQKDISLLDMADMVYVSYNYMSSLFTQNMGINFSAYLSKVRIEKACELLKIPKNKVADIAKKAGYSNYRYFNFVFKKLTGYTPSEYRRAKYGRDFRN